MRDYSNIVLTGQTRKDFPNLAGNVSKHLWDSPSFIRAMQ